METGRKGTGCYCGKLKLVVSAGHDTAHKINNQGKRGQSQNKLRDEDKEQGKGNKKVKTSLKQRGVRVIVAYLLGNLSDRFLQNKSKRKKEEKKRKEMYICKLKSKKANENVIKWSGCPGHSNNQSGVI